MVSDDHIFIHF